MALIRYVKGSNSKCSFQNPVLFAGISDTTKEMMLVQEKVLQNPVILQVILKHLLQKPVPTKNLRSNTNENDATYLCTQNARRLRLVCRAWLLEVNLVFRRAGQPLIFLTPQNLHKFMGFTSKERNNCVAPINMSLSLERFSFKCISLPRTITRMEMDSRLSLATLVLLRSNILEEMRVLKLNVIARKNLLEKEDLAIFARCLKQASLSLEKLELGINGTIYSQNRNRQVALNFQRMANLKKMKIQGVIWRLHKNSIQDDLGKVLPKLVELELRQISGYIFFEEWCRNSVFWSVRSLALNLLTDVRDDPVRGVPLSVEAMQQVLGTFPRVVHLQLGVMDARELNGLRYLFEQMGQLTSLQLNFAGEITSKEEIDGLFIGAGTEMVRRLKGDSALWGKFLDGDLGGVGINRSSIRDLKFLKSLILQGDILMNTGRGQVPVENIPSDLAFELGFMQLLGLDRLVLEGSFGVSEEMADRWCKKKEGRNIEFKRKPVIGWISRGADAVSKHLLNLLGVFLFNLIRGKYALWDGNYVWTDKLVEIAGNVVTQYFVLFFMEIVFRSIGYVGRRFFNVFN